VAFIPTEENIAVEKTPTETDAAPWNQQLGRTGNTNLPASNCYRSLGGKQKKGYHKGVLR